jgi:hypothetical protein
LRALELDSSINFCISTIFLLLILFSLRIFLTSFGNFTLNVLFTKLSISVIIFFPVDELKQEWHQYKSLHARAISGFFKGLSKLDNRLYSTEKLSEHLIKSYEKGSITEDF